MISLEDLEQELREALNQLYDPLYQPSPALRAVCAAQQGGQPINVRTAVADAIASLKPPEEAPPGTAARRLHDLLHLRYLEGLTQEDTARKLGISPRWLRRQQRTAAHLP